MADIADRRFTPNGALFSLNTRATHSPSSDFVNVSLDYNAAPNGRARGTEVIIPDNSSPQVRAAAEAYNQRVVEFARANGIPDYPNRGVKTRSENGRGVNNTVHTEPFFNTDSDMQRAIQANPQAFSQIYQSSFGGIGNARIIAAHGVGNDRGATSDIFGSETDFGRAIIGAALSGSSDAIPDFLGQSNIAGGAGDTTLQGQQANDRMNFTPKQISEAFEDFTNGSLSPEAAAQYQSMVADGSISLPNGESMPSALPPLPDFAANADVIAETYGRYSAGQMGLEEAAQYSNYVSRGLMGIPAGATMPSDPLTPSADGDTRTTAQATGRADPRFAPDLTQQFAAESGGDLARQAIGGLTGANPSPTGAVFPNAPGFVRGAGDVGLATLGGLGAIGGAAAGAVGDAAEAVGLPGGPQLARDLAAVPEALAGSPVTMGQSVARQAVRAAPDAPAQRQSPTLPPATPLARIEPPITREIPEPRQLNLAETNEMRSLIARAANNNTAARNQLAEMAKVNPEAQAAATRLGLAAPVDVFATNAGVTQAAGIVRAVRGSDASVEWEETFTAAQRRANELIETEGGTTDLSAISARVQDDLKGSIDTLRADAGALYDQTSSMVPAGVKFSLPETRAHLENLAFNLGGVENLEGPDAKLYDMLVNQGGVTYDVLMRERRQIGKSMSSALGGPYVDADGASLTALYSVLGKDQIGVVSDQVGDRAVSLLENANGLYTSAKDLEANLILGFGKDQQGSIANTLRSALTNASRGDAGRLNRILNVVPKDLQRETLLTGLADLSQAKSALGGFSFAQYAKTYRGLRDNSEIYSRVAPILGDQTADIMRDLYEVSIRMSRADANIPRTGQSNQALIADGLLNGVLNSSMGRAARGMAAGIGASAVGGPALGSLAAVGASSGKVGKNRAEAVSRLFRDPAFQKLAEEAAARGQPAAQTVTAASNSIAFRRWAGINGIESPDTWISETIARLASQTPQGETTGQQP
jgi:hypothetical protein